MQDINKRLNQIAEYYGLNRYADFAKKTGLQHQTVSNYLKGKQKPDIEKLALIKQSFKDVSANWLLTGEGEMLLDSDRKKQENRKDLRELLAAKDKIIILQQEKITSLEQKENELIDIVRKALKPYIKTLLQNQDIIAGALGKVILDIDDVANGNEKENKNH